ncbi:MAG: tRNA lysidine(34) synthetase TilS [Propionicimonas sp.]|uniref:tRNA lysidine(34) synthetase TilS n=1 Tax=Propionicimonas sp. TaxID=1955623 RepID=UPI003D0B6CBE
MARRALGPATLLVVRAVDAVLDAPAVVACSGGPDSLALAAAAAVVARRTGQAVRAAVVDHGLQDGSAAQASLVVDQLSGLGLAAQVLTVAVEPAGDGVEAAARRARYAALEAHAAPDELVLLGHTLDDQAETVLLGLARGSGTRSLAGMPDRRGRFVRPLLGLRASTTRQACAELGLSPWTDPHNDEARFTRVRVRNRLLPVLEAELGPGVVEALARSAELAREDADLLDRLAAEEAAGHPSPDLDGARLLALPAALRSRVLRDWLRGAGASDLSAAHLRAVTALVTDWHGQAGIDVPGLRVVRTGSLLRVLPPAAGSGTGSGRG